MFYSHQLLARKAPLGQIWMAATLHAKMNRRKLDQLNIIKVCEEILYPSAPMALRLSGILMGGVVIVYERKVKLLFDDVTRLLLEINEAWKVKGAAQASDPTRLPKNKTQAKREAVTLPENHVEDLRETGQSFMNSDAETVMGFQQTTYISMRLDTVDDSYVNQNTEDVLDQTRHQVDAADITLCEKHDSYHGDTNTFNRFERFDDIGGDGVMQMDFTPPEHTEIPNTFVPSPEEPHNSDVFQEQHPHEQVKQESDKANEEHVRKRPSQRKGKRPATLVMDDNQNIIPGHIYQKWLQDTSDITSRRKRKRKMPELPSMKLSSLMDLPSIVMFEKLFTDGNNPIYYPASLLEMWMNITQPPHDSPSGRASAAQPPQPSSSSPPETRHFMEPLQEPFEDYHVGVGSQFTGVSIEKQRANVNGNDQPEITMEELRTNLSDTGLGANDTRGARAFMDNFMTTPGNSGDGIRSIPSSGSGHGFVSHNSEANSGRSSKKRALSPSKNSGNGLEPVAEEFPCQHPDPNFKFARRSPNELTPNDDLMVETGPTQTQKHPTINQPLDHITDSIRMHLKTHFDTAGSAKAESLKQLAFGMNKKRAACLFYQTLVLATRGIIKVEQREAYGDILISRGPKM